MSSSRTKTKKRVVSAVPTPIEEKALPASEATIVEHPPETEGGPPVRLVEPTSETELRDRLRNARRTIVHATADVAKDLWEVRSNGLFKKWGYKTFGEYVESEVDFERRKADYLCQVWELYAKRIGANRPDAVEVLEDIGWVRAVKLLPVVAEDGSNLDEWAEKARDMSARDLAKAVKAATPPKEKKSSEFETVKYQLTAAQKENVEAALALASEMAESEKPGHLLDLVCTAFLADHDVEQFVDGVVGRLEERFGFRIVVIDPKKGAIVWGKDHLREMAEPPEVPTGLGEVPAVVADA